MLQPLRSAAGAQFVTQSPPDRQRIFFTHLHCTERRVERRRLAGLSVDGSCQLAANLAIIPAIRPIYNSGVKCTVRGCLFRRTTWNSPVRYAENRLPVHSIRCWACLTHKLLISERSPPRRSLQINVSSKRSRHKVPTVRKNRPIRSKFKGFGSGTGPISSPVFLLLF